MLDGIDMIYACFHFLLTGSRLFVDIIVILISIMFSVSRIVAPPSAAKTNSRSVVKRALSFAAVAVVCCVCCRLLLVLL
jgi:hypothetical protein